MQPRPAPTIAQAKTIKAQIRTDSVRGEFRSALMDQLAERMKVPVGAAAHRGSNPS